MTTVDDLQELERESMIDNVRYLDDRLMQCENTVKVLIRRMTKL